MNSKSMFLEVLLKACKTMVLFAIPLVVWIIIELVVLPLDFFTFRVWETLVVTSNKMLPGPFYPEVTITKVEEGELVPHTVFAEKKKVTWKTDSWGYRNNSGDGHQDIVIIGDSFITGTKLDQDEIMPEVLSRKLQLKVYGFAPADPEYVNKFLVTKRFQADPPETVILSRIERGLVRLPPVNPNAVKQKISDAAGNIIYNDPVLEKLSVYTDRALKFSSLHFVRSYVNRNGRKLPEKYGDDFFVQGENSIASKGISEEEIDRLARLVLTYDDALRKRNMRFIFMPIPDKETVYYKYFTDRKPEFLPRLINKCRELGVETVDIQDALIDANYKHNLRTFFTDDGHWNAAGVEIASGLLIELLQNGKTQEMAVF
jgi:alginate O-acetyltransferase complex protein AlgJ